MPVTLISGRLAYCSSPLIISRSFEFSDFKETISCSSGAVAAEMSLRMSGMRAAFTTSAMFCRSHALRTPDCSDRMCSMFASMSKLSIDIYSLDFLLNSLSGGVGLLSRRNLDGVEIEESNVQLSWAGGVETFICDMSEKRIGYNCLLLFNTSM